MTSKKIQLTKSEENFLHDAIKQFQIRTLSIKEYSLNDVGYIMEGLRYRHDKIGTLGKVRHNLMDSIMEKYGYSTKWNSKDGHITLEELKLQEDKIKEEKKKEKKKEKTRQINEIQRKIKEAQAFIDVLKKTDEEFKKELEIINANKAVEANREINEIADARIKELKEIGKDISKGLTVAPQDEDRLTHLTVEDVDKFYKVDELKTIADLKDLKFPQNIRKLDLIKLIKGV